MDALLPPFGIRQLRDGEPFSILQINENQYQSIIEPYPKAILSYIDDDDGEDVTVGSGTELRQRLEELPTSTAPFIRCYNKAKNEKEDRYIHLFDIQRTNSAQSLWKEHALAYRRARKGFEKTQKAHKDNSDNGSVSSIDLNSDRQARYQIPSSGQSDQTWNQSDVQLKPQTNPTVVLSDAIPSLVENLANLLQTTSETLRKAAEKSRESQTSPIEDVLSGVSNIVTEIGSFGLSLLDNLNDSMEQTKEQSPSISDLSQVTTSTESPIEVVVEQDVDECSFVSNDGSESHQDTPIESSTSGSNASKTKCKFCSLARIDCRLESAQSTACVNCTAFQNPCTLTPMSSNAFRHLRSDSSNSNDGSILDQDTEDADFSRRYPPLMSLRRANTVAGLHNHYAGPCGTDLDNKGPHRQNSWVNRYPHRPIPQVFDAETNRRRNFARDCFPTQKYTPGSVAQEAKPEPTWHFTKPGPLIIPDAVQSTEILRVDGASHQQPEPKSAEISSPDTPNVEGAIDIKQSISSMTTDLCQTETSQPFEYRKSFAESSPVLTKEQGSMTEPLAESSGAFFHRMMRDNPSRRQTHSSETSDRLTRHRSFARQRPNNNPFSSVGRSNTVSSATNPASRLNRPFDPFYPVPSPTDSANLNIEVKTMQNAADTSTYGTSEPRPKMAQRPHSLHRPFSPVWEEHLNQIKVHKDQINKLDRNGESSSMYSPPPRHMRSVPNFAVAAAAPPASHSASAAVNVSPIALTNSRKQPTGDGPSTWRNSLPPTSTGIAHPFMFDQASTRHPAARQLPKPSYSKLDLNPFHVAAVYAPLPRSRDNVTTKDAAPKENKKRDDAINNCLTALREMGYGLGDRNLWSRLHVYAEAADGNVTEAVDMIEQDKRANSG